MVFSSFTFIALFLPIVLLLHYASKNPAWRNGVLLLASLFFYAWGEPRFVLIMLLSILVNYATALLCQRSRRQGWRAFWTGVGVMLSLAFLFWFKYYAFLVNSVCALFGLPAAAQPKTLPIGISFYTFQIITYTVDVYRGKVPAQRNLGRLALYISFFPQLIAGPIVNYTDVEPQLARRKTGWGSVYKGLSRFIIGLGKKVLIANVCGEILSKLTLTGSMSVLSAWLGAIAFSFQIYFDFSGYSDMAIGLGRMFGFRFKENFRYPYISQSVTEFWRRWHISLGSFFRDYVYIPLGGNRVSAGRHIVNILAVWMLTGAWHGASWNFLFWGLYYGLLLILEKHVLRALLERLPGALCWLYTTLLAVLGWVIFYHESLADGLRQIGAMFGIGAAGASDLMAVYCLKNYLWVLALAALACVPWRRVLGLRGKRPAWREALRAVALSGVFALSLLFLAGSSFNPFLYFRF
ncbi:MAG: MBOAT family protein [Oscillospiraceae bacterium]|nr:MBOAT family protein [Oscillospiraceae bacterium]